MTSTLHEPPPPPPADERRLVRDPDDKVVAGVCAAFARYTGTDPVLWRVTVAVLAVFGGAGLALYALGWLLVPARGEPTSIGERLIRSDHGVPVAGIVLLAVGAVVVLALLDNGPGPLPLLVVAGIAFLVARERRERPAMPYGPVPPPGAPPGAYVPPPGAYAAAPGAYAAPPPPRRRSALGLLTLSLAAIVTGVLLVLRAGGTDGITAARVIATALLVIGAGLVVGAWWGRARWLVVPGVLLAVVLAPVAALDDAPGPFAGGWGERTWTPTAVDRRRDFQLGAGQATLDLTRLRGTTSRDVAAQVGAGQLVVLVPSDVTVRVVADVRLGEITSVATDGRRTDLAGPDGTDLHEEFVVGTGDADIELDLAVGVGEIEVRRVAQ